MARVIKVGGSLFAEPELPELLRQWLRKQPAETNILIPGGGRFADEIRVLDQRFQLGEYRSHALCVRLLGVTAELLSSMLPEFDYEQDLQSVRQLAADPAALGRTVVFNVEPMLRLAESDMPGPALPHSWDVTSDSIAAQLAQIVQARELVLLKSIPIPVASQASPARAAQAGYVDTYFPQATQRLRRVRLVNLRAPES